MEIHVIEDAVTAGILAVVARVEPALELSVSPQLQADGKVRFVVRGDYQGAAIFNLKQGNGKVTGNGRLSR